MIGTLLLPLSNPASTSAFSAASDASTRINGSGDPSYCADSHTGKTARPPCDGVCDTGFSEKLMATQGVLPVVLVIKHRVDLLRVKHQ